MKIGKCSQRSTIKSSNVTARTGVASTMTRLVAYIAQTNSGRRNHVIPGARNICVVAMKLTPAAIEEKPAMKTPIAAAMTWVLENIVENGV